MKTLFLLLSLFSITVSAQISDSFGADRNIVPEVSMSQYLVASSSEFPAIQTYGLATCVGVFLYDANLRQGALMHVAAGNDIQAALDLVLSDMEANGSTSENITAQLFGGWDSSMGDGMGIHYTSDQMVESLLSELDERQIIVTQNSTLTKKSDVDQGAPSILNLEMDLSNGAVYPYSQTVPFYRGDISRPMP